MRGLIIIAHGSRVTEANEEVARLSGEVSGLLKESGLLVSFAFLGNASPAPMERIDEMIQNGIREIVLFPYFLSNGRHVKNDLPELKAKAEKKYPKAGFVLTTHLGGLEDVGKLIERELDEMGLMN